MSLKTVEAITVAELEEKRSRFIAHLVPYNNFYETLEDLRRQHRKANHHVTALRWFSENDQVLEIAKDDGEPSGTSGMPILKTLAGANLVEVGIIVTRYFGGTKLGTGGLARAYSGAAGKVIADARLVDWKRLAERTLEVGYDDISDAERK
ncbi:MAG: YigZ family protein [Pseudomonadota bacterium]